MRFRAFRNYDPPALARLWNRWTPPRGVARPLSPHDFDGLVAGKLHFDADGLIVAERDGKTVGFVHAGFGPEQPGGPSHRLNSALGTIAMLVVEGDREDPELENGLVVAAERYLKRRGAAVVYAGGQYPLNPFYWGLYGGSEFAGVLESHTAFHRTVKRLGYEPVSITVLLETDLTSPELRDPMAPVIRRQARTELLDDVVLESWWDALAMGLFRPMVFRLVSRADELVLARALTWDMAAIGHGEGQGCTGLTGVEVEPQYRQQGYGRHLMAEILRQCREQLSGVVAVQTSSTNEPALALYQALGFKQVGTSTLYRLPVRQGARSAGEPLASS